MAVMRHNNGQTVVVTLGRGDTAVATAKQPDTEFPDCIVLANRPLQEGVHNLRGDEVVIQFLNIRGVLSMHLALADLLSQWPLDGLERKWAAWAEELKRLVESIPVEEDEEPLTERGQSDGPDAGGSEGQGAKAPAPCGNAEG